MDFAKRMCLAITNTFFIKKQAHKITQWRPQYIGKLYYSEKIKNQGSSGYMGYIIILLLLLLTYLSSYHKKAINALYELA